MRNLTFSGAIEKGTTISTAHFWKGHVAVTGIMMFLRCKVCDARLEAHDVDNSCIYVVPLMHPRAFRANNTQHLLEMSPEIRPLAGRSD
ncbi:hypothetical protein HanRHA438_Chr00c62g0860421 [Helianthus annuus]|nr:hypothetical protein HanRHA438_Chr00c62g0860421 [Helianthus annuus]